MTPQDDLIAWRARDAARMFDELHGTHLAAQLPQDPGLDERLHDAVRPDAIRAAVGSAATARPILRLLLPAYLDAVSPSLVREARAQRVAALAPWNGDVDEALAAEPDPKERAAIELEFRRAVERVAAVEGERDAARDEAARAAGCDDEAHARRLPHVPLSAEELAELERGFLAPLDDAVAARHLGSGDGDLRPSDVPRLAWQPDSREIGPSSVLATWIRRVASTLRLDTHGALRLERVPAPPALPVVWEEIVPAAIVVTGTWGGAWGGTHLGECAGRAMHVSFLRRVRGPLATAVLDPAYAHAAGWLFRRIAAADTGPMARGDSGGDIRAWMRLEDLIAVRLAVAPAPRAGGRPLSPGEAALRSAGDDDSRIRGAMLAALVEERLMSRFGRAWFDEPAAGHYLRDLWAAEPDGDPASMAAAWGLGTMDSSPLFEAFRLRKGREL